MSPARLVRRASRAPLATLGYLVLTLAVIVALVRVEQLAHQGEDAHQGLCELRQDVERRIANSKRFLADHPGREPIPGLTRTEIQRGIANQQRTIDSLGFLRCPPS